MVNNFPPEIGSAAQLFYELGKELSKERYSVTIITATPRPYRLPKIKRKKHSLKLIEATYLNGNIKVLKLPPLGYFNVKGLLMLEHQVQPFMLMLGALTQGKHDVVIAYSPPITIGLVCSILKILWKAKTILNVQDPYPETAVKLGLIRNKIFIKIFEYLSLHIYKTMDFITVHSHGNKNIICRYIPGEENKVVIVYNWVDTQKLRPLKKLNEYRRKFGDDKFIVLYAGIMSVAQDLVTIIEAAKILSQHENILFVLAGDGTAKPRIKYLVQSYNLKNVIFLPFQPYDKYPLLIAASDICLVPLVRTELKSIIPKKLLDIMACARPVIALGPKNSEVREIILKSECGIYLESGKPKALAETILYLYSKPDITKKMSINGRIFAVKNFDKRASITKYIELIDKA